jgi:hypothetical protein
MHSGLRGRRLAATVAAFGTLACAAGLNGCTSTEQRASDLLATTDISKAQCVGRMLTQFDVIQVAVVNVECGALHRVMIAWPTNYASLHMTCAFTFDPAVERKGTGRLICDNGRNGNLTYDRTDPKNVQVETNLDNGDTFDFLLREDPDYPNKDSFPD